MKKTDDVIRPASAAKKYSIETREQLLSALSEASELEHGLMCLYLYAVFSLKTQPDEHLSFKELEVVNKWRKIILGIAIEEMGHLCLVSNLISAVGGSPHFFHPPFPASPGYYPADFAIELAGFSKQTLEHFIFLERSHEMQDVADSSAFATENLKQRISPGNRLMSHPGEYATVGELYEAIKAGFNRLSLKMSNEKLFCGPLSLQLTKEVVNMEGVQGISDLSQALSAIDRIVEQGEGSVAVEKSHFAKFTSVATEFNALSLKNPNFNPAFEVARNPLMRKPPVETKGLWISAPQAAKLLDIGNSVYNLMLRLLAQTYAMESRPSSDKKILLEVAFTCMHAIGIIGKELCHFPATPEDSVTRAGFSFTLNRHFSALELKSEKMLILERLQEISEAIKKFESEVPEKSELSETLLSQFEKSMRLLSPATSESKQN